MHYSSLESLSLPRRQRVFDKQLVPEGDPLPIWKNLPLDSKLPVVPCPPGSYTLFTTKVGQPKYIHKQHYDFDLGNALYARPSEYDSLHDPCLKEYFDKPRTKRLLVQNDLITRGGKVKCDIKEFNKYRAYLRYRSVTELSLQRSGQKEEDSSSWLTAGRPVKSEQPRSKLSIDHSATSSQRDADSTQRLALYARDVSLVQRMRMREKTLVKRMREKERERERQHEERVRESWISRKQRQKRLLQQEETIDEKMRESRAKHILRREKTLAQQRSRMMAKLGRTMDNQKKESRRKVGDDDEDDKTDDEKVGSTRRDSLDDDRDEASDNA